LTGDAEIVSQISADFKRLQRNREAFEERFKALEKARGKKARHKAALTLAVKNPETGSIGLLLGMSAEDQADMISIMINDSEHKKFIRVLLKRIKQRRIFKAISYVMPSSFRKAADDYKKKEKRNLITASLITVIILSIAAFIIYNAAFIIYNKDYSDNKKYSEPLGDNYTNTFHKVLITESNLKTEIIYKNRELNIPELKEIKTGDLFYVYDYYPRLSKKPQSSDTKSLLIGLISADINNYEAKKEPRLIGWIDRTKVAFRNTRIGCEFPVGSTIRLKTAKNTIISNKNDKPLPSNSFKNLILEIQEDYYKIGVFEYSKNKIFPDYLEGIVHKDTKLDMYILVTKKDIEAMIPSLSQLLKTVSIDNRRKVWERIFKMVIGENPCTDSTCDKMQSGIPVKAGFMRYTKSEFLNPEYSRIKDIICQAKILRERFRLIVENKKPDKVFFKNKKNCDFKIAYTFDINGDGFVVKDGKVSQEVPGSNKLKFIRQANDNDLIDKYFFKEGGESVAWIPLEHFGEIQE
jgi:hypothetical protein